MKYAPVIDIEITDQGPVFKGSEWPLEVLVDRALVDFPQGPHVQLGKRGALQFVCTNGFASYRRLEDRPDGWLYVRVDSNLVGAAAQPVAAPAPTPPPQAGDRYRFGDSVVEAFQWLPYAVPPLELPHWFMRLDFEHNNQKGIITLRNRTGPPQQIEPTDWVVRDGPKITAVKAKTFATEYTKEAA